MELIEWEDYLPGHPLIRQPLLQTPGGTCQFAALSRHMDYELRIASGKKNPAVHLPDFDLIDQDAMRLRYLAADHDGDENKITNLFRFAKNEGFRLWNGQMFRIHNYSRLNFGNVIRDNVVEYRLTEAKRVEALNGLLEYGTVVGSMIIYEDYRITNEREYVGEGRILGFHAVVITGVKRTPTGYVFIYQDSRGPANGGLLGMGRNQARLGVLLWVFRVWVPTNFNLLPDV